MSPRELVVLGTASQTPTRARNHNGYLLRWGADAILFDPGEGTQRQLIHAGIAPPTINRICITHFHGDHCLGLPGILHRLELDQVRHPVDLHYPASGEDVLERLLHASLGEHVLALRRHPTPGASTVCAGEDLRLRSAPLRHRVDAVGWRVEAPDGRRMLPDRLDALGIAGPDVGRLRDEGSLVVGGRRVDLEEVSEHRPGTSVAVVMDTAWCDAALELAEGVDLLLCESTFLSPDQDLAERTGHLTARQAARLAVEAGARRLVLTHFSQRYRDVAPFLAEAAELFPEVIVAEDLQRVPVPARR